MKSEVWIKSYGLLKIFKITRVKNAYQIRRTVRCVFEAPRVLVVNLKTGEVGQFEMEPTYSAHPANAYEDGDDLVVDLCPTPYINLRTYLELEK